MRVGGVGRGPGAFSLYSVGLVVLHLSLPNLNFFGGDVIASDARYMTAAVPAFIFLGQRLNRRFAGSTLLVSAGFLLQAALLERDCAGGYVG